MLDKHMPKSQGQAIIEHRSHGALLEGGWHLITTSRPNGRIVPTLKEGAGVVTPRALVHYVVTEFGIANLFGKNLFARAKALIGIAHPDDRSVSRCRSRCQSCII
jgi:hypothetical protein